MPEAAFVLVDDEKPVLDSLKQELRRGFGPDYLFETAESVAEAWEVIEELADEGARIVVVVSDWLMPEVRGDSFLSELSERHPTTLRIMLTGHVSDEAVERLRDQDAVHAVVSKPWNEAELQSLIREGLAT